MCVCVCVCVCVLGVGGREAVWGEGLGGGIKPRKAGVSCLGVGRISEDQRRMFVFVVPKI